MNRRRRHTSTNLVNIVYAVMQGINSRRRSSGLNSAYTYTPTCAQVLAGYNRSNYKPVYLSEANYENGTNCTGSTTDGLPNHLRGQEYRTMTSGAAGYLSGNETIVQFASGWQTSALRTTAYSQFKYFAEFFGRLAWYDLVPDESHAFVTAGYGTPTRAPAHRASLRCREGEPTASKRA